MILRPGSEQQFANAQIDEMPERAEEGPSRSQGQGRDKEPEAEKRRPRPRRERMQPRVDDTDSDESLASVERAATRRRHRERERREGGSYEKRRREPPRAEPELRKIEKGNVVPPGRRDTPSSYVTKQEEPRYTQPQHSRKDEQGEPAPPERGDTPLFLEKRTGGGYHSRPAAKFAREDLRPFSAPQSPLTSDDGRDGASESNPKIGSPTKDGAGDGCGGASGSGTRSSAKQPTDDGRDETSGNMYRPGGAYHRRPDAKFAREDLRPPSRNPRSLASDDGRDEASGSRTESPRRTVGSDDGREEAPRSKIRLSEKQSRRGGSDDGREAPRSKPRFSEKQPSDGGFEETPGSRTKKRSSKRRSRAEENDPFANFPLNIRPVFNTNYHPS